MTVMCLGVIFYIYTAWGLLSLGGVDFFFFKAAVYYSIVWTYDNLFSESPHARHLVCSLFPACCYD